MHMIILMTSRRKQVNVNVTDQEYDALVRASAADGLATSSWIRMTVLREVRAKLAASKAESDYLNPFSPKTSNDK